MQRRGRGSSPWRHRKRPEWDDPPRRARGDQHAVPRIGHGAVGDHGRRGQGGGQCRGWGKRRPAALGNHPASGDPGCPRFPQPLGQLSHPGGDPGRPAHTDHRRHHGMASRRKRLHGHSISRALPPTGRKGYSRHIGPSIKGSDHRRGCSRSARLLLDHYPTIACRSLSIGNVMSFVGHAAILPP